jgi:hypothetical protein
MSGTSGMHDESLYNFRRRRCRYICRLIDQGARLQEGDVWKLDARLQREVTAVDLTADTDYEDIEDAQGMQSSTNQEQGVIVLKGYFVKDAMQRLIAPELQAMEKPTLAL